MTSKRNLENRIERIDEGRDYPMLSLAELIAAEDLETIDNERGIVRVDGTLMDGSELRDALEGVL